MLLSLVCTCNAFSQFVNNVDISVYGWPLSSARYLKQVLRKNTRLAICSDSI